LKDVEHVGLYWKPWILRHKATQALKAALISPAMFKARADRGVAQVSKSYLGMFNHPQRLRERFGASDFKFHFLEHHQCHAASAFFVSPFESAAILTWDGTGEDGMNGFLADNETEWHDKLKLLIENPELRKKLGKNARKTVLERFDIEKQFDFLENKFKKLKVKAQDKNRF